MDLVVEAVDGGVDTSTAGAVVVAAAVVAEEVRLLGAIVWEKAGVESRVMPLRLISGASVVARVATRDAGVADEADRELDGIHAEKKEKSSKK